MRNSSQKKKNNNALEYALKLISKRDYSEFEIRRKLNKYTASEVEETILKLKGRGLLLDEKYAANLIDKCISKKYGFYKVEEVLRSKGVLNSETKALLAEKYSLDIERKIILNFLNKKPKDKLYPYLIQRGFRSNIVQEVLTLKD
ncbi:MAG: RecX family transcriptional regulator [Caldisericaceae bacterium]